MLKSLSLPISFCASFLFVMGAQAQVMIPEGVYQMANGAYYQPSSGIVTFDLAQIKSASPVSNAVGGVVSFPLKKAIDTAVQKLEADIAADAAKTGPRTAAEEADMRPVTLAVWNPKTDQITYVRAEKEGVKLNVLDPSPGRIRVAYTNGLNSTFIVDGKNGESVIAIRYPIYTSRVEGKKTIYDITDVVYMPYSGSIHTSDMVKEGERWLADTVKKVYDDLRTRGIHSRAFPDKLVADVIDPTFVTSVLLIEHTNPKLNAAQTAQQLERFAVTLAGNKNNSYAYSRSSAGALGLAQFIPSTYRSVATWKEYGLDPNFVSGMRTPTNAIKAQIAYLDYLLSRFPKETIATYETNRLLVEEYMAAAYNGGPSIVVKAMKVWEENLDANERAHVLTRSRLKLETMYYVLKLRRVREALKFHPDWLKTTTIAIAR